MRDNTGAAGDDTSQPEVLRREPSWLEGHIVALDERLVAHDARREPKNTHAEAADPRVALNDPTRAEEWRRSADAEACARAANQRMPRVSRDEGP
jgi:hypothetical protein